ncbi:MAG: ribose 5-phosphate isomerase A, partial [Euryarchaeota archaeon]|nr:ribose 5-phosphate isomerase A [Euryarchaeota archaeon]
MEPKEAAALSAARAVKEGQVVGLGTGSTVYYAIKELGRRVREEDLDILGVPTSLGTELLAVEEGIK